MQLEVGIHLDIEDILIKIHTVDDPKCFCGLPIEDVIHYLLEFQLYYNQRISIFKDLINMNIEINIE
jgi:hypothetical protein